MPEDLEIRIREIGSDIITRLNRKPPLFSSVSPRSVADALLALCIKNNRVKTSLFRFIDVLPAIKSDKEVVEIFLEYLGNELAEFPAPVRQGLKWVEKGLPLNPLAAKSIRYLVESLSSRFILGTDPDEARPAIGNLRKNGVSLSLDLLGESTLSQAEGLAFQNRYLDLLNKTGQLEDDPNGWQISVKISSLNPRFDPANWKDSVRLSAERLRPILEKAKELRVSVMIDMESYYFKDLILETFTTLLGEDSFQSGPVTGIALQAYLKETPSDLDRLIDWSCRRDRNLMIRLVKGAYWDYEVAAAAGKNWPSPVLETKRETDLQFEETIQRLLNHSPRILPVIATHNIRTVASAIARNEMSGFPKEHLEFQMLFGMAEPLQKVLTELGYRVRIYAPTGDLLPGMAYLIRRMMENSVNQSILGQAFSGQPVPFEVLAPIAPVPPDSPPLAAASRFKNEPPRDFSKPENRERVVIELNKLLAADRNGAPVIPLIVDGKGLLSARTAQVVNPAEPDQILGSVSQATHSEGELAVQAALRAFPAWKHQGTEARVSLLQRVAGRLRTIRHQLIALEILEVGKSWKEADGDVCEAIDFLAYYAGEMIRLTEFYENQPVCSFPGEENRLVLQPVGVMAAIPPWNFPLALAAGMIAAGLVAGNCVLFKPSSFSQLLGARLTEVFLEEGVPPGVLQFLPGRGSEIGEFLIQHPEIPLIAFTGSNEVGKHLFEAAAVVKNGQKQFKKVIAEMGGKNAIIVDESADLDEAILGVIESAFGYQGQKCSACSRVIVHQSIYREFLGRLKGAVADLERGDPRFPSTFIGPVINRQARDKISSYIETGFNEAKPVYVRKEEGPGYFVGPAVFEEVPEGSPLARDEIFGPVLSVFKSDSFEDALKFANDSLFALTGGIYSRKPSRLLKAREQFNAGNLYLNRKITGAMVGRQPFGGFNLSGVGMKTGGPDYLLQFMQVKAISENTARRGYIPE